METRRIDAAMTPEILHQARNARPVIPGRAVARAWIPGLRQVAHPGMTKERPAPMTRRIR